MPRTQANPGPDADQPKSKRQKLTDSQLERKRELDREAQRTIRERTKNHIAHLEALVQQLQGDQGSQVERLVAQLNESRAEVNRLKDALSSITKISASILSPSQPAPDPSHQTQVKQETSPDPPSVHTNPKKRGSESHSISSVNFVTEDGTQPASNTSPAQETHPETYSTQDYCPPPDKYRYSNYIYTNFDPEVPSAPQVVVEEPHGTEEDISPSSTSSTSSQQLSVSQMASSIMANEKLEGRYWYLAGVLLTEILKKQQQDGFLSFADDEDIAIRAVFDGWSSVAERYPLDRGWQWLKELDETIYFHHFGPAERLMNLRNCRLVFLRQCYPNADWESRLPNFYNYRPAPSQDMAVDPLGEHFPWPGFRKQLQFAPRKYATNQFMESLRRDLRFVWRNDSDALYHQNSFTGIYTYSELFLKHINDVKSYAARPSFFEKFPELSKDIPWNRHDEPSPLSLISHRPSIDTMSTRSTDRPSPITNDDDNTENGGRLVPLTAYYSNQPQMWHALPNSNQHNHYRRQHSHHHITPGFVKELSNE